MPMLAPEQVDALRPHQKRVFVPPRVELDQHCSQLQRSAIVLAGPYYNDRYLPHRLSTHLTAYFGLRAVDFEINPVYPSYGDYIAIFPTQAMRDRAVYVGVFNLGANVDVQLTAWTKEMSMTPDPTSHLARLRLHGVPFQNWNEDDLDVLLAGVGHVAKVAPFFQNGNYEFVRVLVACHQPINILKTLLMTTCPHAAVVVVELEGWIQCAVVPYHPDEANAIRIRRRFQALQTERRRAAPPQQQSGRAQLARNQRRDRNGWEHMRRPQRIWIRRQTNPKPEEAGLEAKGPDEKVKPRTQLPKLVKKQIPGDNLVHSLGKEETKLLSVVYQPTLGVVRVHSVAISADVINIALHAISLFNPPRFLRTPQLAMLQLVCEGNHAAPLRSPLRQMLNTWCFDPKKKKILDPKLTSPTSPQVHDTQGLRGAIGQDSPTGPSPTIELRLIPRIERQATIEDPQEPLGFEGPPCYVQAVRRSPRLQKKSAPRYTSAMDKAKATQGLIRASVSIKKAVVRGPNLARPCEAYLKTFDPLTEEQAEAIVATAGVELCMVLTAKISEACAMGGRPAETGAMKGSPKEMEKAA